MSSTKSYTSQFDNTVNSHLESYQKGQELDIIYLVDHFITDSQSKGISSSQLGWLYITLLKMLEHPDITIEQKGLCHLQLAKLQQSGIGTEKSTMFAYHSLCKARELGNDEAIQLLTKYRRRFLGGYEYIG